MDVLDLLKQDHRTVRKLLEEACDTTEHASKTRRELLQRIVEELEVHTAAEETILYPYLIRAEDRDTRHEGLEATEEHHLVQVVLDEIQQLDVEEEQWLAKATVLRELVEHHVEEEEEEMFDTIRELFDVQRRQELGEEVRRFKKDRQAA
ncbi:MAG: hemerythrin domain-containing protein [Planctomycetota bacterium]